MDMGPQVDNHYLQCLFSRQRRYLCHQNKDFHIRLNRLSYHYHHYLYHHYRISLARLVEVGHRHCSQNLHRLLHHHHHYLHHHHNLSLRRYLLDLPVLPQIRIFTVYCIITIIIYTITTICLPVITRWSTAIRIFAVYCIITIIIYTITTICLSVITQCYRNQDLRRLLHHHHHHLLR